MRQKAAEQRNPAPGARRPEIGTAGVDVLVEKDSRCRRVVPGPRKGKRDQAGRRSWRSGGFRLIDPRMAQASPAPSGCPFRMARSNPLYFPFLMY
jgi:hypothetical protein